MKIKYLLFLSAVVFILPLNAQDAGSSGAEGAAVFAPFVSRLQGEARNNLVRLSWVDSRDARGPVHIYRSDHPFEGAGPFQVSRYVEVLYGAQSFIDEIESGGLLYYFVAASDETGRSYDIPIIFTNTISVLVSIAGAAPVSSSGPVPVITEAPAVAPGPAAEAVGRGSPPVPAAVLVPGVSSMEAVVQGDKVIITFSEGSTKSATLYRSIRPITQTPDLLGAVIIQTRIRSPFTDFPVPGIPYYYAVISEEDLVRGAIEIIPGRNATRHPVEILPGGIANPQGRDIRAMPLPQISVQAAVPGMNAYNETPPPAQLSPQAAKALGNIPERARYEPVQKNPRVFARDLEISAAGDEYTLSSLVKGPFAAKNWAAARDELVRFLVLPRNPEITARARFYLGQCYYFLHQSREGLFEFLAIRDRYPAESMEWIQASLDMMKE